MRQSFVSREYLMSHQSRGIYGERMRHEIFSWDRKFSCGGPPHTRKSPVSCLMIESYVSRENFMSHEIFSWDIWRRHETWDFLVRQEIFLWGGAPKRKSPVFYLTIWSHISRDYLMGFIEKAWDMRLSPETGDFLVGRAPQEKISCLLSHEKI